MLRGSPEYGQALEHLIFLELRAYLGYRRLDHPLTFWRSQSKHEVDFLIGDEIAIEVKAADLASERALTGLRALAEELPLRRRFLVCHEKAARITDDGIEVLPLEEFLRLLWQDRLL